MNVDMHLHSFSVTQLCIHIFFLLLNYHFIHHSVNIFLLHQASSQCCLGLFPFERVLIEKNLFAQNHWFYWNFFQIWLSIRILVNCIIFIMIIFIQLKCDKSVFKIISWSNKFIFLWKIRNRRIVSLLLHIYIYIYI